jgi:hypothetical protein
MVPNVGFLGQMAATSLARACGGDPAMQSKYRKIAASLTIVIDPIGTGLGMVYEWGKIIKEYEEHDADSSASNQINR